MNRRLTLDSLVRVAAGIATLVGFAVLLGWVTGIPLLRSGLGAARAMNPASALLFFLSAVSLWGFVGLRRVGLVAAALVLLGASLLVAAPLLGLPAGFELALVGSKLNALGDAAPRPLSAGSAIVYLLIGASLLLVRARREALRLVGRSIGLLLLLLALLSLVVALVRLAKGTPAASSSGLGIVVGLLALALGLASAGTRKADPGQEQNALRGNVSLALSVAVAMLLLTTGLELWSTLRSQKADAAQRQSLVRRGQLTSFVDALQEANATRLSQVVDSAKRDTLQARRLQTLRPLFDQRLSMLARDSGQVLKKIQAAVLAMTREEDQLSVAWTARRASATSVTFITNFLAGALAICFLILAARTISRDFKEKSRIEAERDRFFTMSLDLLCIAKSDGYFKRINPAFTATLGWSMEELLSRPFLDFVHPEDREATLREVERQTVAGEPVLRFENRYRHKDGSWRVLSWRSVPQPGGLMYATARDVTETQRAQAVLQAAKDAADEANRAKSDFLAKMSHELRTPLNSIIGFSEIMEAESAGPLSDKQKRYVGNVLVSGRNLLQLINDILDLSKVEAGRMELITAPFHLGAALAQAGEIVAPLADKKRLTLELTPPEELPPVLADQTKVKQILYNLLSNAIKFTPEGGWVTVSARRLPGAMDGKGGAGTVEVAVSDTGIGIAPEHLERIFHEFEQVGNNARQNSEGTGLGLALTRKLVELHGGRIAVESEPGRGSTFRFTLPCVDRRTGPREPPPLTTNPQRLSPLVLVVDDDPRSRDLITHYLEESGYRAICTSTGVDAVRLAREQKPDAITLDLILPDREGLLVLAELKSDPETRRIPVVVVSITERSELGFSLGAEEWLVKPVQQDVFLRALDAATAAASSTGKRTILVVDDDPGAVEYLSELVRQRGCEVLSASNGRDGVALALRHQPDAIILDLAMPEMNGFEAVKALRDHSRTRNTPILIVTAMDLTLVERQRLQSSVQGIVTKGWQEELLGELARICHHEVPV